MNWFERQVVDWARRRGFMPEPSLGLSSAFGAASDDAPADYLEYVRTSNVVYACASLRARMMSGLPLRAYRMAPKGDGRMRDMRRARARLGVPPRMVRTVSDLGMVEEVSTGALVQMLTNVNPDWTWRNLVYMTELSLCLAGQAFWMVDDGEVWFVKHTRMTCRKGSDRPVAGWIMDDHTSARRELESEQVIWFRYPDPSDPDYGVLPPMAAARLGADSYSAAMKANKNIFDRGINAGGLLTPGDGAGGYLTPEQLTEIANHLETRLKGADKSHSIGVAPYDVNIKQLALTPKDAEFQALLDFSIEDVGRAFGIPVEFIGGSRRTYQNLENAMVAVWMQTLEPEASWLADELTEKLLAQFKGQADFLAFDLSGVSALQADETAEWAREREQITTGVLLPNEWRADEGLQPLPQEGASIEVGKAAAILTGLQAMNMGTVSADQLGGYLVQVMGMTPEQAADVIAGGPLPMPEPPPEPATPAVVAAEPRSADPPQSDANDRDCPAYGTREHETLWRATVARPDKHSAAIERVVTRLMERQRQAVVERMKGSRAAESRMSLADLAAVFQRPRWVREFREAMRRELKPVFTDAAKWTAQTTDTPPLPATDPPAVRFLHQRAQRFAEHVNETTWQALHAGLGEAIKSGAGPAELSKLVDSIMGDRIRSSARTIAITETHGAYMGGAQVAAKETGLDLEKTWVSALDDRVRDDHRAAHGQTVGIDEDFNVGGATGPAPGDMGDASQDINCRCVTTFSEKRRQARPAVVAIEGVTNG